MAGGTGVEIEILTPAVEAELHRIIRDGDRAVRASYAARMRPYLFRIIREVHPWLTRDMWAEIAGVDAPVIDETREQGRRRRDREVADARALLQQHGRPLCCPDCDIQNAAALRHDLGAAAPVVPVQAPEEEEEEEQERTCACDACDNDRCQGDCDQCDDHGCEQCYAHHEISDCCGYCEECDRHPDGANGPNYHRCTECDHCSECDHYCR